MSPALLLLALAPAAEPTPLFDGTSLAGWAGDTAKTWRVEDGAITGGSLDAVVPRNEFLATAKRYSDFELTAKFRLLGDPAKTNAGIQIRSERIPNHHEMVGYQADIGQGYWGALYDESRRNKILAKPPADALMKAAVKAGDWNTYRVRCEGPRIRLWLNGVMTVDYTEPDSSIPRDGLIALQVHGGAKTKVQYKDIRIGELEPQWWHWRGPTANGTADPTADPPVKWTTSENIKWKAPLTGRGSGTPVVWGDLVIVPSAEKTDRQATPDELPKPDPNFETRTSPPTHFYRFLVTAFDRHSGTQKWQTECVRAVPHEGHHETHSYAAGSPTTDGDRVYVSFGSFGTFALDAAGKLVWAKATGRLHTRLGWGEAVTPVVHGGSLLLNLDQERDAKLLCVDAATGKTKWTADREEKTSWNTPLVTPFAGKTQVIVNGTTRVRSYDLDTGKELWAVGGMTTNAIPSPVRFGDTVIAMSGYRGAAAVAVPLKSTGDLGTGPAVWRHNAGTPYVPSPAVAGNRLYFTEGNTNRLTVLDAATGKPKIEREPIPGTTSFYASPLAAAGRVYFTDRTGTTTVLKAGDTVEVLATNKLGDPVDASPIAVGRALVLRGAKFLYWIEGK